jgi:hypothetical protein
VKDTESTFFNVSKLAPFFSFNNIQDLGKTVAQSMKEIIIRYFVGTTVTSMANDIPRQLTEQ